MGETTPWTFKKAMVEQYQFNGPYGVWAIITLDPRGIFQAVSDFGEYAYDGWGHHGCESFKHFLVCLRDEEYFIDKVTHGRRQFAYDKTIRRFRRDVLEKRRDDQMTRQEARSCWDDIDSLAAEHTCDRTYFVEALVLNTEHLARLMFGGDPCAVAETCCEEIPAMPLRFFREVFRGQFVPALTAEIAKAAEAPHA